MTDSFYLKKERGSRNLHASRIHSAARIPIVVADIILNQVGCGRKRARKERRRKRGRRMTLFETQGSSLTL